MFFSDADGLNLDYACSEVWPICGRMHHLSFWVSGPFAPYPLYTLSLTDLSYVQADYRADGYTEWDTPAARYMSVGMAAT